VAHVEEKLFKILYCKTSAIMCPEQGA